MIATRMKTSLISPLRALGTCALLLAAAALFTPMSWADNPAPTKVEDDKGHATYKGFEVSGKYILTLKNVRVEGSSVYWSQVAQAWLIDKEGSAPRARHFTQLTSR